MISKCSLPCSEQYPHNSDIPAYTLSYSILSLPSNLHLRFLRILTETFGKICRDDGDRTVVGQQSILRSETLRSLVTRSSIWKTRIFVAGAESCVPHFNMHAWYLNLSSHCWKFVKPDRLISRRCKESGVKAEQTSGLLVPLSLLVLEMTTFAARSLLANLNPNFHCKCLELPVLTN